MKIRRIEHVAIAVSDIGDMTAVLRDVFGLKLDYVEDFLPHKTRVALFPLGDSAIELVQGLGPEARSAKWVAERGQSLFHICLEVEDIDSALDELRGRGIKLIHDTPSSDTGSVASRLSIRRAPAISYSNWQNLLDRKPSKEPRGHFVQLPHFAELSPVHQRFDDNTRGFNEKLREGAQRPIP